MSDKSRDLYRGLLIPDGDLSRIWAAESTVDEAGNRAGVPATSSKTETVLESSGHQNDVGEGRVLEVLSLRGGYPGPGEAGYGWRQAAEGAQDWRGWDVPAVISSWENVDFNSSTDFNLHPDLVDVTRTDGTDYMVTVYEFVSGTNSRVAMRKREGDTWGAESVITVESGYVAGRYKHPSILVLPTGRLLVFYWVYDHLNSITQIQMQYSDDEGASWTIGADYTLPDPIDTTIRTPGRIRVGYKDGQILLLTHIKDTTTTRPDLILQYASDDFGTSFLLVLEMTGADAANSGGIPDVAVSGGIFVVTWIAQDGLRPAVNRLGTAYQPIAPSTPFLAEVVDAWAYFTATGQEGDLSIAADRDGVVYLYGTQEPSVQGICCVLRSYDGGENWGSMGVGGGAAATYGRWWGAQVPNPGNRNIQPVDYTVEFHRGRAVVVHRYLNATVQDPIGENSLCFFYLGGFSSVVMPGLELFKRDVRRVGLPCTWVPFSLPGDSFYTRSLIGGGVTEQIISPGVLEIITPVGSRVHYIIAPAEGGGNNDVRWQDGFIGRTTCEVKGAPSRGQVNNRLYTAGGGGIIAELRIFIYNDRIDIIDGVTSAILATTPNDVDRKRQIFWAIRGLTDGDNATGAECAVWIRDWNTNEDRYWELVYQGSLTIAGSGVTTSFVHWGDREVATECNMWWSEMEICYGRQSILPNFSFVGYQLAQGQANPEDLFPRNYSSSPLYVDSDTRIAAIDGPTFEADQWTITARHLQGTENVFASVSPSPAKTWRSKTANPGDIIAFQRNPDGDDAWSANDFYAIHFENVNFKRAQLQILTGGVWVNVVSISFYREFKFRRSGHTIRPFGDDRDSFYAYYNEFKGLKFEFNPDPLIGNAQVATILRNSEGIAYEGTNAKPTTIFLDPDTFDSATAPNSGTAHLWFKNMTVLIPGPGAGTPIEGLRLRLCQTGTLPPEGFFSAGNIIPGPVCVFGWDYSRERNITKTPNVELTTLRDGTRHAYKAGDERRRVRFSWAEGVDVTQLREEWGLPLDPDYVKASAAGEPVALRQDGPLLMWGLLDRIDGPGLPVVYIPKIDFSNAGSPNFDPRQYARGAIYGRTVTPITLETVVGAEEKTEVYRVNTVTIEEEL